MKIITYDSGLGNQIFVALFGNYLQSNGYHVYSYFMPRGKHLHNGSKEIINLFDMIIPPNNRWVNIITPMLLTFKKIRKNFKQVLIQNNDLYNRNSIVYVGWWQDIDKYFDGNWKWFNNNINNIKFILPNNIGLENERIIKSTQKRICVSLHVRRGDYLIDEIRQKRFKTWVPLFYPKAIAMIKEKYDNPMIIAFSDDPKWVMNNIDFMELEHEFVSWNKGMNSYLDMYLMSQCSASIIANSTFSYWGAMLGKEKDLVIYPKVWLTDYVPNIFPNHWQAL